VEEANGSTRYANVTSTIRASEGSRNQIYAFWTCAGNHTRTCTRTNGPPTSPHSHPTCSTSGTDRSRKFIYAFQKPLTSPQTLPDMDVDVGGSLDRQGDDHLGGERDAGSEEIVKQLEKGLPRWEGFGDAGWMDEADHVSLSYALSETFKVLIS
jgi:hypothetical protein